MGMANLVKTGRDLIVFVDVQNMYHTAKLAIGAKLSYQKLLDTIICGRSVIRLVGYIIDQEGVNQTSFINHLQDLGFDLKRKKMIERRDGSRKADTDVALAMDAVKSYPKCDTMALVTGDGDFVPLVQYLQSRGVKVEVYSFQKCTSDKLIQAADRYYPLDRSLAHEDFPDKVLHDDDDDEVDSGRDGGRREAGSGGEE